MVLTCLVAVLACSKDEPAPATQPAATVPDAPTATPRPLEARTAVPAPPTPSPAITPSATPITSEQGTVDYYGFDHNASIGDPYNTLSPF